MNASNSAMGRARPVSSQKLKRRQPTADSRVPRSSQKFTPRPKAGAVRSSPRAKGPKIRRPRRREEEDDELEPEIVEICGTRMEVHKRVHKIVSHIVLKPLDEGAEGTSFFISQDPPLRRRRNAGQEKKRASAKDIPLRRQPTAHIPVPPRTVPDPPAVSFDDIRIPRKRAPDTRIDSPMPDRPGSVSYSEMLKMQEREIRRVGAMSGSRENGHRTAAPNRMDQYDNDTGEIAERPLQVGEREEQACDRRSGRTPFKTKVPRSARRLPRMETKLNFLDGESKTGQDFAGRRKADSKNKEGKAPKTSQMPKLDLSKLNVSSNNRSTGRSPRLDTISPRTPRTPKTPGTPFTPTGLRSMPAARPGGGGAAVAKNRKKSAQSESRKRQSRVLEGFKCMGNASKKQKNLYRPNIRRA